MSSFAYNPFTDNLDYRKGTGGLGGVVFITGNSGGPVESDGAGNFNFIGHGGITFIGNPATNTQDVYITGGGFSWTEITSATKTIVVSEGYITNRGGGVTYTLPATATQGDIFKIAGKAGIWSIAQNANQQMSLGSSNSTIGVGGSFTATNAGDCITMLCITGGASTVWRGIDSVGNITIV